MPGPCSAPNGNASLVNRNPKEYDHVKTGKTAVKRGDIKHANKRVKLTRKQRERENES